MKTYFVSVTGHRPDKLGGEWSAFSAKHNETLYRFRDAIHKVIEFKRSEGFERIVFISGMALGIDSIFVRAVEIEKMFCKDIEIIIATAVPCPEQDKRWSESSKEEYKKLLAKCDEVKIVSPKYSANCMQVRNEFMVDHSHLVLAYWDGTAGGTKNCIDYALQKGIKVYNVRDEVYIRG